MHSMPRSLYENDIAIATNLYKQNLRICYEIFLILKRDLYLLGTSLVYFTFKTSETPLFWLFLNIDADFKKHLLFYSVF